jgi:hypothetical protein
MAGLDTMVNAATTMLMGVCLGAALLLTAAWALAALMKPAR